MAEASREETTSSRPPVNNELAPQTPNFLVRPIRSLLTLIRRPTNLCRRTWSQSTSLTVAGGSTLLMLLALASPPVHGQTVRYVTDSLRLDTRRGPSTSHRIVRMVPTGTRLEVLEEKDGWSRVRLSGDSAEDAWILTRFLRKDPPPRQALADARERLDSLEQEHGTMSEELEQSRASLQALNAERDSLAADLGATQAELEQLKRTASSAVEMREENQSQKRQLDELGLAHKSLTREFQTLRASRERDWFVAGGGVLLAGMLLGFIIPKIRWRRRRGWNEL